MFNTVFARKEYNDFSEELNFKTGVCLPFELVR